MPEFRSENRIRWLKGLSRIGPIVVIVAITFGLGSLRIAEDVLFWALVIVLGVAVTGFTCHRPFADRHQLDWRAWGDLMQGLGRSFLNTGPHRVVVEGVGRPDRSLQWIRFPR